MNRLFLLLFGAVTFVAQAQVPDYVPTEGLVGWYPLNGDAQDNSTYQNHGFVEGAVASTNRFLEEGSALSFDGGIDYAQIEHGTQWDDIEELAISMWFYTNSYSEDYAYCGGGTGSYNELIHKWGPAWESRTFEIRLQDWGLGSQVADSMYLNVCGGNAPDDYGCLQFGSAPNFPTSEWIHLAVLYSNHSTSVYINGNLLYSSTEMTFPNGMSMSDNPILLGNFLDPCTTGGYNGMIDDLGFWNRALTASEITALYNAQLPVPGCTDTAACNFDAEANEEDGSCIYPALGLADCDMGGAMCGEGTVWDASLQACVSFDDCPSDLNENGFVDVTDLLLILADFGSMCPTESSAWTCGDPYNYQGYNYATVEIGESCWFQENLRASFYANNFPIPYVQEDSIWSTTEAGALCDYGLDANNGAEYGRLYNAHAVAHPSGLCPSGWHVSSLEDWSELDNLFGGFDLAGAACKASPSDTPPWDGTNESGLTALPGGQRYQDGTFSGFGEDGFWWLGSTNPEGLPLYRMLYFCDCMHQGTYDAQTGFSVRCVKD